MSGLGLYFNEDSFNRLFPFYLQLGADFQVLNFGKSLAKVCPDLQKENLFTGFFEIVRPHLKAVSFQEIIKNSDQYILLKYSKTDLLLRGQFEQMGDTLLFVGSPWFTSMSEVIDRKLTFDDFAHHDALLDLLHVLNNAENTSNELKELLLTINTQKNQLKKDKEELNRLSYVASANKNGVVFTKLDGSIFWCNDAFLAVTGYSKSEIIGKTPIELGRTTNTDKKEIKKMVDAFYSGNAFEVDLVHARKNGDSFWSRVKGQPIADSKGNTIQYFAILEDISLKKRYDESLEIEKEKYRGIIANMNLGLLEVDLNGMILMANQSFLDMSGYDTEELIGNKASGLFLTQEGKKILESKDKLRSEGVIDSYEVNVIDKSNEDKTWLISGAPNYDIQGNLIGSIGIHLDITDQKEQEQQLYLLSLIAEKNINAVIISDATGRIEWANPSFLKMSGYTEQEILGKKPGDLLQGPGSNKETVAYMSSQIAKGLPFNCEIVNYSKNKEKYWVRIQGQALYDKNGVVIKFFAIEEDITAQKALEKQKENLLIDLAKTNKELEDYAQIVSHDLKSPLRSINSLISWIKEENEGGFEEQTMKYFSLMEHKVEKMDHLIEGILTYSKIDKEASRGEKVNTNDIIKSIIDMIHVPEHIKVTISNPLPVIKADRFRIQQLFQNLIGNAVNYIDKEKGLVEIACEEFASHYVFSVADNGVGMPKEIHDKIFETFKAYTTSKHSTGLGLSIVKKIVLFYKGEIWLDSEEGKGTTFYVKLKK
ncbi:PAS domain-containing protein [uncultured Flavobacterium sp.]|mgnify:CR=1 FL=1|uniref:PAS domain S-box protein n=1 Tax=uncultured Flavobacterium sp. TaxID=165435 RepID=UPI0030EB59C9|tara:strand:+ start:14256 stop:16553 length:2298 start_codon:yes stop_codon:yes gene_type:complete